MVALKRRNTHEKYPPWRAKQERRGGIETRANPDSPHIWTPKQERRGGIETENQNRDALGGKAKQERRGGIETMA